MKKVILIIVASLLLSSCKKNNQTLCSQPGQCETVAEITVQDVNFNKLTNCSVRLYVANNPSASVDVTQITNSSGVATFIFEHEYKRGTAWGLILDVEIPNRVITSGRVIEINKQETTIKHIVTVQ